MAQNEKTVICEVLTEIGQLYEASIYTVTQNHEMVHCEVLTYCIETVHCEVMTGIGKTLEDSSGHSVTKPRDNTF